MSNFNLNNVVDLSGTDLYCNTLHINSTQPSQITALNQPGTLVTASTNSTVLGPNSGGDDTTMIQNTLNTIHTQGGGTVYLGPFRYQIKSANLTIPTNCVLAGMGDPLYDANNTINYTSQIYCLVISPSFTISMNAGSSLRNLNIQSSVIFTPTSIRDNINMVAAFTGTAITINGSETTLENIFCIGFNTLLSSSGFPRVNVRNFYGDGTNGIVLDNSHDISRFHNVHLWPFVTANSIYTIFQPAISGAADNGSGLYRITLSSPQTTILTGDTVYVGGVGGALGANAAFTATVVDTTHIDLQSSATAPTFTANNSNGSAQLTNVSSFANLVIGQTVSGTNIPAATTIKSLWPSKNIIVMSANSTGTNTGITVTVANGAYTSGGKVFLLTGFRSGTGIKVSNSDVNVFVDCFVLGYLTAAYSIVASNWETFIGCNVDSIFPASCVNTAIGVQMTGATKGTQWIGGSMQNVGINIQCISSSSEPQVFSSVDLNSSSVGHGIALDFQTGAMNMVACVSGTVSDLLLADAAGQFNMSGCNLGSWNFNWQTNTGVNLTKISGSVFGGSNAVYQTQLPASDPHILNRWWSNSGVVTISAG